VNHINCSVLHAIHLITRPLPPAILHDLIKILLILWKCITQLLFLL